MLDPTLLTPRCCRKSPRCNVTRWRSFSPDWSRRGGGKLPPHHAGSSWEEWEEWESGEERYSSLPTGFKKDQQKKPYHRSGKPKTSGVFGQFLGILAFLLHHYIGFSPLCFQNKPGLAALGEVKIWQKTRTCLKFPTKNCRERPNFTG